ncbi:MAG: response regulator [Bryobacteraceae bacterium]|nr:response regulator [Bryobacteraceae bacterium]
MFHILIAEDNPPDAELLRDALESSGLKSMITVVETGDEFLAYAREACDGGLVYAPDLILLDWNLPRGRGSELVREIRLTKRCAKAPIFVFTSSISPKDREEALKAGATRFFSKPTHLKEFMAIGPMVRAFLEEGVDPPSAE